MTNFLADHNGQGIGVDTRYVGRNGGVDYLLSLLNASVDALDEHAQILFLVEVV